MHDLEIAEAIYRSDTSTNEGTTSGEKVWVWVWPLCKSNDEKRGKKGSNTWLQFEREIEREREREREILGFAWAHSLCGLYRERMKVR